MQAPLHARLHGQKPTVGPCLLCKRTRTRYLIVAYDHWQHAEAPSCPLRAPGGPGCTVRYPNTALCNPLHMAKPRTSTLAIEQMDLNHVPHRRTSPFATHSSSELPLRAPGGLGAPLGTQIRYGANPLTCTAPWPKRHPGALPIKQANLNAVPNRCILPLATRLSSKLPAPSPWGAWVQR